MRLGCTLEDNNLYTAGTVEMILLRNGEIKGQSIGQSPVSGVLSEFEVIPDEDTPMIDGSYKDRFECRLMHPSLNKTLSQFIDILYVNNCDGVTLGCEPNKL